MNQDLNKKRHFELLNYNKKRHLELLKYSQDLKQQGKSIHDESRKDYLELLKYSAMLNRHLYWETRDQYLELLNEFMEKKIDITEFCDTFCRRSELNDEAVDMLNSNLILLSPHEKSIEFSNFMGQIFDCCEVCNGDPEPLRESYEIGHTEFQHLVEKIYFSLQKFLEE
jgi:hypothetical protein